MLTTLGFEPGTEQDPYQESVRLSQGAMGNGGFRGCGEFNPFVLFSRNAILRTSLPVTISANSTPPTPAAPPPYFTGG